MKSKCLPAPTGVTDVAAVAVPVSDQDRAIRFYVERLGFEVRLDAWSPAGRWVHVAAPGGAVALALVQPSDAGAGAGRDTGITLATADAAAEHAALAAAGVAVDELLRWSGAPSMFVFRDLDGNELKIMETAP